MNVLRELIRLRILLLKDLLNTIRQREFKMADEKLVAWIEEEEEKLK